MAMADQTQTPSKRPREEEEKALTEDCEDPKRQKSYNQILSLLDEEEEEPSQDLSSLITTLQQELSSEHSLAFPSSETGQDLSNEASASTATAALEGYASSSSGSSSPSSSSESVFLKEDDESEKVMRHLLEASDDELGIPQRDVNGFDDTEEDDGFKLNGLDGFNFGDGLWEFEDHEAANYYTLVQSELFMM